MNNTATRNETMNTNTTANGAHIPSRYTACDLEWAESYLRDALANVESLRSVLRSEQATKEVCVRALEEAYYHARQASHRLEDALAREAE
jgi:hypothetical protein